MSTPTNSEMTGKVGFSNPGWISEHTWKQQVMCSRLFFVPQWLIGPSTNYQQKVQHQSQEKRDAPPPYNQDIYIYINVSPTSRSADSTEVITKQTDHVQWLTCVTLHCFHSSCECTQWRDNAEKERERSLSTYTAFNCCDFVCQRRNKRVGFGWGPVFLIFFYHVHINLKIHTDHNYRFKMCQTNTVSSDDEAKRTWPLLYWPVD